MSVITKIKAYATMMAVIATLGAWYTVTDTTNDDESLLLSSKWDPAVLPLQREMLINITLDGIAMPTRRRRLSPYSETILAAKGVRVVFTVTSIHPRMEFIDCIILRNGKSINHDKGFDSIGGPGMVRCEA